MPLTLLVHLAELVALCHMIWVYDTGASLKVAGCSTITHAYRLVNTRRILSYYVKRYEHKSGRQNLAALGFAQRSATDTQ